MLIKCHGSIANKSIGDFKISMKFLLCGPWKFVYLHTHTHIYIYGTIISVRFPWTCGWSQPYVRVHLRASPECEWICRPVISSNTSSAWTLAVFFPNLRLPPSTSCAVFQQLSPIPINGVLLTQPFSASPQLSPLLVHQRHVRRPPLHQSRSHHRISPSVSNAEETWP